jgi:hypothetical protein
LSKVRSLTQKIAKISREGRKENHTAIGAIHGGCGKAISCP